MNISFDLWRHSLAGLRLLVAATLVCGVAYPLVVFGLGELAAPWQTHGSLVATDGSHTTDPGRAVGSQLIGQVTDDPALFYDRPSAAGDGYDMLDTYGSNLGPNDPSLVASIRERQQVIAAREHVAVSQVPPDAVTASGSGLDPDISVAYADLQISRVARANGLTSAAVARLIAANTSDRTWGILGEPRVNVLMLNIAVRDAAQ